MTFGERFRQYAKASGRKAVAIYGPTGMTEVTYYGVLASSRFTSKHVLDQLLDAVLPDPDDDFVRAEMYALYLHGRMQEEERKGISTTSDVYSMVTLINVAELAQHQDDPESESEEVPREAQNE